MSIIIIIIIIIIIMSRGELRIFHCGGRGVNLHIQIFCLILKKYVIKIMS
jgi:hypothetical protein